jgi:Tol biopolymer transport system component
MALMPGTKFGPYEIQSPLGAGGMGEVYRARDTRLGREVAIKVLSQHLSSNPDLKARFEREAKAISALNHPHICHLYDVGSQDGTDFLVMELLEGESLDKRLERGPLPLRQALEVGVEIAEALEKAHKSGIVHRDLKPGNIVLTKSGAKLLDFGLAKPSVAAIGVVAASSSGKLTPSTPTMSVAALASPAGGLTQQGTIVGTFQYMAPECLQGREAGACSDLFSFGCVLYEMVTGRRAFEGKSQLSVLTAILEKDPEPVSSVHPGTPPALEHAVRRALEKDPERRWQSAADLTSELRWIAESDSSAVMPAPLAPRHGSARTAVWVAAVVVAALVGFGVAAFLHRQPIARAVHSAILPPEKTSLVLAGDNAGPPVLSPDGAYVAFSVASADGAVALWLRPLDSPDARRLPGTEGATFPFWSPDSHSIGIFANGKLKVIDAVNGGAPFVVCEAPFGRGGAWSTSGVIVFAPDAQTGLMRVDASGGTPGALTTPDPKRLSSHRWPFFMPDGKHFIYLGANHDTSKSQYDAIYYASLDGKENRELFRSMSNAVYAAGYLLFARGSQLMAQPFDASSGKLEGSPQPVANDVANDPSTWHMDASAAGPLLVLGNGGAADQELVYVDRSGKQLGVIADGLPNLLNMSLSPQGDRLALEISGGTTDIWVQDLVRGVRTRLTFGPAFDENPVWSPDGKWVAYDSQRDNKLNIYRRPSDGSGVEELLLGDGSFDAPLAWSPDNKFLLYRKTKSASGPLNAGGADSELWALPLTGERKPFFVVAAGTTPFGTQHSFSPNGRWLAYTATQAGSTQVYVMPFGSGHGKWQISQADGFSPRWRSDGKELFYASETSNNVIGVPVEEQSGTLQFGAPQSLYPHSFSQIPLYEPLPGGKKFIMNTTSQQTGQAMGLFTDWTAALKP